MTGRALTKALIAAVTLLAAVCLLLVVDAMAGPERVVVEQAPHTGTTAPRPLP